MKSDSRRHLKSTARALGLNRLFWHVVRLLDESQISPSFDEISDADVFGHFRDSRGKEHPLIIDHRDRLKPKWRTMFQPPAEQNRPLSRVVVAKSLDDWRHRISTMERFLEMHWVTIAGKVVVEIGAYGGATAVALARGGSHRVIGADIAAYYVR